MSSHSHRPRFVPCVAPTFASPFAVIRALLPLWQFDSRGHYRGCARAGVLGKTRVQQGFVAKEVRESQP